jgi:beta-lactam-binding protein with PASTA domain
MQSPDTPDSQVMAQAPPPNASGVSAPKISLLVAASSQPQAFVMPSFTGQQLGSSIQAVQNSGMKVGSVTAAPPPQSSPGTPVSPPFPGSTIVTQNPLAGEKVLTGATVNFEVR